MELNSGTYRGHLRFRRNGKYCPSWPDDEWNGREEKESNKHVRNLQLFSRKTDLYYLQKRKLRVDIFDVTVARK